MIGKIPATGTGFRGSFNYIMHGKRDEKDPDRVAWAESRNLFVQRADTIPRMMRETANRSTRCKKPVYHLVISWRPDEAPTDDMMRLVADTTLSDLGLAEHQAVIAAHRDTDHRHLHIIVNRVHPETGKAWHTSKDWARLERSIGRQAKELGFEFVPGRHNSPHLKEEMDRRARDPEYQAAKREGKAPPTGRWSNDAIKQWRQKLAPHFAEAKSWDELSRRLAAHDLRLEAKGQGLVITGDHGHMKLSDLGKGVRMGTLEAAMGESFSAYALRMGHEAQRLEQYEKSVADARVAREAVRAPASPVATPTQTAKSSIKQPAAATSSEPDQDPATLTDEQKQRLREEARERRIAEREAELAERAAKAPASESSDQDDDTAAPDMAMERRPSNAPAPHTPDPQVTERREAFEQLGDARAGLDIAEALQQLGITNKDEVARARQDVKAASEDLQKTETLQDFAARGVSESQRPQPPAPRPKKPEKPKPKPQQRDRDDDQDRER